MVRNLVHPFKITVSSLWLTTSLLVILVVVLGPPLLGTSVHGQQEQQGITPPRNNNNENSSSTDLIRERILNKLTNSILLERKNKRKRIGSSFSLSNSFALHSSSIRAGEINHSDVQRNIKEASEASACSSTTTIDKTITTTKDLEGTSDLVVQNNSSHNMKEKVCIVGSGNWGSAIATIVGQNCARLEGVETTVNMWVYEEDVTSPSGQVRKLSHVINEDHENIKYLPGIKLPTNVRAVTDLSEACRGATLLIFVLPHQFLPKLLPTIRQSINRNHCRGISLIKGIDFVPVAKRPVLISETISKGMGNGFQCGVLMGANVANEVAKGDFCESTLACHFSSAQKNEVTRQIFHSPHKFHVNHITDVAGAEACGALKNVIALGAGFIDGLHYGGNTKAALLRVGLLEMYHFCHLFLNNGGGISPTTFFTQSCGMADLITTCYGGRNRKCAEAFVREQQDSSSSLMNPNEECIKRWNTIEQRLLGGQKLQGTLTCQEVYLTLEASHQLQNFPLMTAIYRIAFEGLDPKQITNAIHEVQGIDRSAVSSLESGFTGPTLPSIKSKL